MRKSTLPKVRDQGESLGRALCTDTPPIAEVDIELFAGGGGMAVGLRRVGFSPSCLVEWDRNACETLRANIGSDQPTISGRVIEGDAEQFDWSKVSRPVRLLAAGAPCQPFSLAGKHLAERDGRNLFPQVLRAVRTLKPQAIFLENVRGLKRHAFQPYFEYIRRQLEAPSVHPKSDELWQDHDERLLRHRASKSYEAEYQVVWRVVDAADYGVPQNRHRVFVVAVRSGLPAYAFPEPTHSQAALWRSLHSGEYSQRHRLKRPTSLNVTNPTDEEVNGHVPWRTVRDALSGLPKPTSAEEDAEMNHWVIPGARSYPGHTGSIMDLPAKTIKAGVHGVPGGENSVVDDHGVFRYLTLRETARIQSFPDEHIFSGARIHVTRQIGNAVPCSLAEAMAKPLVEILLSKKKH